MTSSQLLLLILASLLSGSFHRYSSNRRGRSWLGYALITTTLSAAAAVALGSSHSWIIATLMAAALPAVSAIDLAEHRIPNPITGTLAVLGVLLVLTLGWMSGQWPRVLISLAGALAVGLFYLICALIGGLGLGDVKLATALAVGVGWLGMPTLFIAVLFSTVMGVLSALVVVLKHRDARRHFAFGPSIAAGFYFASVLA